MTKDNTAPLSRAFIPARLTDAIVLSYIDRISTHWRDAAVAILATGKLCARVVTKLSLEQQRDVMDSVPFEGATFSKLARIGRDHRLEAILRDLPAHWTSIYNISLLTDDELAAARSEGIITPDTRREDIIRWKARRAAMLSALPEGPGSGDSKLTAVTAQIGGKPVLALVSGSLRLRPAALLSEDYFAGLRVPSDYPEFRRNQLNDALDTLAARMGAFVVRPGDQNLARQIAFMRRELRHVIGAVRRERLALARNKKERREAWPFSFDERIAREITTENEIEKICGLLDRKHEYVRIVMSARLRVENQNKKRSTPRAKANDRQIRALSEVVHHQNMANVDSFASGHGAREDAGHAPAEVGGDVTSRAVDAHGPTGAHCAGDDT